MKNIRKPISLRYACHYKPYCNAVETATVFYYILSPWDVLRKTESNVLCSYSNCCVFPGVFSVQQSISKKIDGGIMLYFSLHLPARVTCSPSVPRRSWNALQQSVTESEWEQVVMSSRYRDYKTYTKKWKRRRQYCKLQNKTNHVHSRQLSLNQPCSFCTDSLCCPLSSLSP